MVENSKFDLVDSILKVARETNAEPTQIKVLEQAQSERQFSKAIEVLRDVSAIPAVLLINGQNPLTLIFDDITWRRNGSSGRGERRDSQNICGEGTTPSGPSAPPISRESAGGDPIAKDGCHHSSRARKNGAALEYEHHERKESQRFKSFICEELTKRDNVRSLSTVPGFPRHTQSLDASRHEAGSRYSRAAALDPDIIAAEIVEDL